MIQKSITIGFLSDTSPKDKSSFSGTFHSMAVSLKKAGYTITWIPVKKENLFYSVYRKGVKVITGILPGLKKHLSSYPFWRARIMAKSINKSLLDKCDIIFAPMQSIALSMLKTSLPIVYLSDATFRLMVNYYWFNLNKRDVNQYDALERMAMDKASTIIYPSNWAVQSAIQHYGQAQSKIHLAFFGPNLRMDVIQPHVFSHKGVLNILFVGVDWERKGGDVAVETCQWLNENGIPSVLHIVGIRQLEQRISNLPFVQDEGFLNKNNPDDYLKLVRLYEIADCFLLPTHAECAGICFAEACSFGLPCFAYRTGGVEDYILDGKTGRLLPLGNDGEEFGHIIKEDILSGKMEDMSKEAFSYYNRSLNWDTWIKSIEKAIESVLSPIVHESF